MRFRSERQQGCPIPVDATRAAAERLLRRLRTMHRQRPAPELAEAIRFLEGWCEQFLSGPQAR